MHDISSLLTDNPIHSIITIVVLIGLLILINHNPPPDGTA